MGNRAVITVEGSKVGIYVHWNGGRESVTAFLRAAKDLGVRTPASDPPYFYARLVQIIGNFFGGTTSVGIDALDQLDTDNGDNGVYYVDEHMQINWDRSGAKGMLLQDLSDEIYAEVMRKNRAAFKDQS